jgi:threonine dehydrogenase-like Zn-dependent dehydrogenase
MKATMQAAVFDGPGRLTIESRPVPVVSAADDVVINVQACGVCGSDLQILANPPGHPARQGVVLGHEIFGTVVDAGRAAGVHAGERVVVDPDIKCGHCPACDNGRPSLCENLQPMGIETDGGFAEYCKVPARGVFRVDPSLTPTLGSLVEPLASVLHGVRSLAPTLGDSAVIIGGGTIGCLFVRLLQASGVRPVWVIEPLLPRRELATSLGATGAVSSAAEYTALCRSGGACRPSLVVDAVGACLEDAVNVVADGGRVLLFGINASRSATVRQFDITVRELTVIGSVAASFTMEAAVRLIEAQRALFETLPLAEFPLERIAQGIEQARSGEVLKAVIRTDA